MAISNTSKARDPVDVDLIRSEVASFASSIGLSSSSFPNSDFDDSDFRKSGPLKPPKAPSRPSRNHPKSETRNHPPPKKHRYNSLNEASLASLGRTNGQDRPKLPLMKASALSGQWHVDAADLEAKVFGSDGKKMERRCVEEMRQLAERKRALAEKLMEQYAKEYELTRATKGDMKLIMATQRSGTAKDKVAAFTCMIDDNPIANLRSLDALLALVTSKVGKRHALTGFDALMDLFLTRLLPYRKLKFLMHQPLSHLPESRDGNSLLLFWYWEDCLKQRYKRFVVALEEASKDMLPVLKDKALKTIYSLLTKKPEEERRLLCALVNKLGDPVRNAVPSSSHPSHKNAAKGVKKGKAATDAMFLLLKLLDEHPNMKAVVIDEVDSFIFREHLGHRAKYYAVLFLSEIRLSKGGDGPKIAKRLMDVYFALFKVLITEAGGVQKVEKQNKKEDKKAQLGLQNGNAKISLETNVEMDSRLLVVILTGAKRAFPYVASDEAEDMLQVQTPLLYKLVHSKNFNVGIQALMLLYDISSKNQIASDRFYRALYAKLPVPAVMHSSKSVMFLQLLVNAMKNDVNLKRVSAFSKRLLQVALQQPPQYACGCLLILSEILKARPPLWNMMLQSESVDEDFEHFEDIIEEPQNADGSTVSKTGNSINVVGAANGCNSVSVSDSSESEDDKDPQDSTSGEDDLPEDDDLFGSNVLTDVKAEAVPNHVGKQSEIHNKRPLLPGGYNPQHREPFYCNAERTSWWELTVLSMHVHPSVATMARTLLSGAHIIYNGDPLTDLSLSAFLDKFMEKKPKPNKRADGIWHGGSQIAPARKMDVNNKLIGADILSLAEEDVPPEDLVFHRFYMNKTSSSKKLKKKKKKKKQVEDEAAEDLFDVAGSDESDNDEIEDMLGSGHLPLEREGDYDYDDLDEVYNEDDEDLLGDASDDDAGSPDNIGSVDVDDDSDSVGGLDGDDDLDSEDADFHVSDCKIKKRKKGGRLRQSPFAKLEDYDHLLKDEGEERKKGHKHRSKSD